MNKKKLLIICFTELHKDPRVQRQIKWLKNDYQITTIGGSHPRIDNITHFDIKFPKSFLGRKLEALMFCLGNQWKLYLSDLIEQMNEEQFDFIIANDLDPLPLAFEFANPNTKVVFDAHEYYPSQFLGNLKVKYLRNPSILRLCRNYISKAHARITVCQGIADLYRRNFGTEFQVITNAANYYELSPSPIEKNKIKLIHHGVINESRSSHLHLEMLDYLDEKFEFNFIPVGNREIDYVNKIFESAEDDSRINLLKPVPFKEIPNFINQFDIGFYILPSSNINTKYSLPNKFFEFIQARLALAIGPSIEMAKIVKEYKLGIVAENFTAKTMANALNALSFEDIARFKKNSHKQANRFSSEKNGDSLKKILDF